MVEKSQIALKNKNLTSDCKTQIAELTTAQRSIPHSEVLNIQEQGRSDRSQRTDLNSSLGGQGHKQGLSFFSLTMCLLCFLLILGGSQGSLQH